MSADETGSMLTELLQDIAEECERDPSTLRSYLIAMLLVGECVRLGASEATFTLNTTLAGNWVVTVEKSP